MINPHICLEGVACGRSFVETYNWRGAILGDMERHRMIRHLVGIMVTDMVKATDAV
jgi:hypothetical protein